jgi:AcrR family transcriptional regulator
MPVRSAEYMEDRREHILLATIGCLKQLGLARTSLTNVCEAAGISRGALYIHFSSKDEILEGVIERLGRESAERLNFTDAASLRKCLEDQIRFVTGVAVSAIGHIELELMIASRTSEPLRKAWQKARTARVRHIASGLKAISAAGELRKNVDPAIAAHALDAYLQGVFTSSLTEKPSAQVQQASLNLFLDSILR